MIKHSMTKILGAAGIATLSLGFAFSASAVGLGAVMTLNTNTSVGVPAISAKSDTAISARITALNNLFARVQEMNNVSTSEKSAISTEVQTQINSLTNLKAKIDADTDVSVARADAKTITGDYRIYSLVIPRGYIVASSDRVATIVSEMTALQVKLQARITALQTSGKDVTALQAVYTDMGVKMADAMAKAQTAQTAVVSLSPDKGSATIEASNKAALTSARTNIKTAETDLKAARKDIATITAGLKVKANVNASATTNTH
jgi:hypothetical protein